MIFTSKRPEDFDTEPYTQTGVPNAERWAWGSIPADVLADYDPRPHFQPTRDPLPWDANTATPEHPDDNRYDLEQGLDLNHNGWDLEWSPRPEFTTPSNPILALLRTDYATGEFESLSHAADCVLMSCCEEPEARNYYSPEQIEHARKVLTRLVAL